MSDVVTNLLAELMNADEGQLIDKGKVVDHLLDLRLLAVDNPAMVATIDELMGAVPGKTMVETSWWQAALGRLTGCAEPELTA